MVELLLDAPGHGNGTAVLRQLLLEFLGQLGDAGGV
jgi:hypothetical protein